LSHFNQNLLRVYPTTGNERDGWAQNQTTRTMNDVTGTGETHQLAQHRQRKSQKSAIENGKKTLMRDLYSFITATDRWQAFRLTETTLSANKSKNGGINISISFSRSQYYWQGTIPATYPRVYILVQLSLIFPPITTLQLIMRTKNALFASGGWI